MEVGLTKFHPDMHFGPWKVCTCISLKILGSCKENVPHFSGHSICLLVFQTPYLCFNYSKNDREILFSCLKYLPFKGKEFNFEIKISPKVLKAKS